MEILSRGNFIEFRIANYYAEYQKCLVIHAPYNYPWSNCRPTSVQNLAAMEEVAEEKARKYGDSFTRLIREFCAGKSWKMDMMPGEVEVTAKVSGGRLK